MRRALALLVLFLGSLLLYAAAGELEFLSYDDDTYLTSNAAVQGGLNADSIAWAFTSIEYACNWHPLTWISHMLDVSLFGMQRPGAHHWTNVVLHAFNGLLLALLVFRLSGRFGLSWLVAAFFVWHPQRVESVAWVSERKDVLAVCFGLASLLAYAHWIRAKASGPRPSAYLLAWVFFAIGLMAKPLLVTLPGCMLLLDYWPIHRGIQWKQALREKLPFLALSIAACAMTLWSQSSGGCTQIIADGLPLAARLQNAAIASLQYVGAWIYPHDLVVFYPHPAVLDPGHSRLLPGLGSALAILLALGLALRYRLRAPYLLFGMLWFLGVMLPMIGIVQVGAQSMADRYTYFSSIGLTLALIFGAADLAARWPRLKLPLLGSGLVALGLYACATHSQIPIWQNDSTLFGHAARLNPRNYIALNALGTQEAMSAQMALRAGENQAGQAGLARAIDYLERSCAANPRHFEGRVDLGVSLILTGEYKTALDHLLLATSLRPHDDTAQFQLALAHLNLGQFDAADACLGIVRGRNPDYPKLEQLAQAVQQNRQLRQAAGAGE